MSKYLLIYLLLTQPSVPLPPDAKWKTVETTTFQWAKGGHSHTLSLEELSSEGGAAVRLRIKVPDGRDFTLSVPGGLVKLSEVAADQKLIQDNLLKSAYLYLTPSLFAPFVVSENPVFDRHSRYPSAYRAIATSTKYLNTVRREYSAAAESWRQAGSSTKSLGDRPLVVLFARFHHERFLGFRKLQTELAQKSTEGKLIIVENSGHHIQHDRPETVVDAVREVVEAVRVRTSMRETRYE